MEFLEEKEFDRDQYDTYLRRIHYDSRDSVNYENMLRFLFSYIVSPRSLIDREGLLEEYIHWSGQLIDKAYCHLPHDLPYRNICRACQSFVFLLTGQIEEGLSSLCAIGPDNFCYDGKAPKSVMTQDGHIYRPVSKLFLLYNYAKALSYLGLTKEEEEFRAAYPHAFTVYGDEEHSEHDAFYVWQMEQEADSLFYPVYSRVYKLRGGPADFFVYCEADKCVPVAEIGRFCQTK